MSYCRMDEDSDIHAYTNGVTHTIICATQRRKDTAVEQPEDFDAFIEWTKTNWEPIKLSYAGNTMEFDTIEKMRDRLVELEKIGYKVPKYVWKEIKKSL